MARKKKKQLRWTFVPSLRTIELYNTLNDKIGPLNKSGMIDAYVCLSIQRKLDELNGGKPTQTKP